MSLPPPDVIAAITRKKARYGRYADTKQWHKYEGDVSLPSTRYRFLDVSGAPLRVGGFGVLVFDSTRTFTAFFTRFFANLQTLHNIGPGDFEQVRADEVKVVWGFEDQLLVPPLGALAEIRGGGFYYETWRLTGGDWFLHDLEMKRTYQKETLLVKFALSLQNLLGISFF
ncbi:hypothetical protein JX265_011271 [Neoarthrinium moseri]|uniref:SnoaL-like domain-containing protein n=1 Tax=Neoarthrinium moseri TaxID=1658444 RepID=A0A9Q0AJJ3_9PEZI|nr:hypothetical protein JX266_005027 [Neoarthrinium moseri]KAI1857070.1 hypothetical protein JX265_011271 [Neoarthrinium moseri]